MVARFRIASWWVLFPMACCVFGSPAAQAQQTLWRRRTADHVYLFHDTKARRAGDLLTVVIREVTDVDNRDQRQLDKGMSNSGSFGLAGATAGAGSSSFDASIEGSSSYQQQFDGSSQYTVARGFTDRMTVTVLDVLPNGNLLIGGKRKRVISGESRTLVVTGVVRPRDIQPDNSVESQYVANFHVTYDGRGRESRHVNGWRWPANFLSRFRR